MAEIVDLDIDPEKVIKSLKTIADETDHLADKIEKSFGRDIPNAWDGLEQTTEKGTNKITTRIRELGKRIQEDLKTALDVGGVFSGLKFGKEAGSAISSIFDLERAFDRLNTRLGLSQEKFIAFKNEIGKRVSATGQDLMKILPGVETVAAQGGVKNPMELTQIGEQLAKARAITGEEISPLAGEIVDILKAQRKLITAQSFKETLDVVEGTRTAGAFNSAEESAQAIKQLAQFTKSGMSSRELGGVAAQASMGGSAGIGILAQIMGQAQDIAGREVMKELLKVDLFEGGKFNAANIGKIDQNRIKGLSGEQSAQLSGFTGASGSDFIRFVEAFQKGNKEFSQVTRGADETAKQYDIATDNLVTRIDRFREAFKNAIRSFGEDLASMTNALIKGDANGLISAAGSALKVVGENKGTVAAGLGISAGAALLMGGGIRGLKNKVLGAAAGVQNVYVTNFSDFGKGGNPLDDMISKKAASAAETVGGAAAGGGLAAAGAALVVPGIIAATVAASIGLMKLEWDSMDQQVEDIKSGKVKWKNTPEQEANNKALEDFFSVKTLQKLMFWGGSKGDGGTASSGHDDLKEAIKAGAREGIEKAHIKVRHEGPLTKIKDVSPTGGMR